MKIYCSVYGDKLISGYTYERITPSQIELDIENEDDVRKYIYDEEIKSIRKMKGDEEKEHLGNDSKIKQEEILNRMMLASARASFLNEISDEKAKDIPLCFDSWDSFPDGYQFAEGQRLEYKSGLWKCKKAHNKQSNWYPGADPTLFEQLDKDEHKGTIDDPIPVPTSVSTSGFTYTYGKYYIESSIVYLFKRGGLSNEQAEAMYGQTETLYFPPSAVVGTYTVKV